MEKEDIKWAVVGMGVLIGLLCFTIFMGVKTGRQFISMKPTENDTCKKVTHGPLGPRLCGYNINVICKHRPSFSTVSPEERIVCEKYFQH